jgi:hypothetical protein
MLPSGSWDVLPGLQERISLVSRSSSSREIVRIRPSALVFTAMMLIVGVLLLATNNIDPKAIRRPTMPVDVFVNMRYTGWTSPDGLIQFEYPDSWVVQPMSSLAYGIVPAGTGTSEAFISVSMRTTASLLSWFSLDKTLAQDTTPDVLLQHALPILSPDQPVTVKPVQAGSLKGAGFHYVHNIPAATASGQAVRNEGELWLLSLDSTHVLALTAEVPGTDWPKMQPVFDHLVSTLKVDAPGAVKAIGTAAPTQAATEAAPTAASTAAPTAGTPPAAP